MQAVIFCSFSTCSCMKALREAVCRAIATHYALRYINERPTKHSYYILMANLRRLLHSVIAVYICLYVFLLIPAVTRQTKRRGKTTSLVTSSVRYAAQGPSPLCSRQ